jgi:hypothetical protein
MKRKIHTPAGTQGSQCPLPFEQHPFSSVCVRFDGHSLSLELPEGSPDTDGNSPSLDPYRKLRNQARALGPAACYLAIDFDQ